MTVTGLIKKLDFIFNGDPSQLRSTSGFRNAVGVFTALIIGIMLGHPISALGVAIGAQVAGFAGLNGTTSKRLRTMLLGAVWMTITSFLAGLVAGSYLGAVLMAIIGFFAGFLVCVSLEAGLVGLWGSIVYILFSGFPPQGVADAIGRGLFVLSGGLLQAILMLAWERVRNSQVEEKSVAQAFVALSTYTAAPSRQTDLGVATALQMAGGNLRDSSLRAPFKRKLQNLLDSVESIRIEVIALRSMLSSFQKESILSPEQFQVLQSRVQDIPELLTAISTVIGAPNTFAKVRKSRLGEQPSLFTEDLQKRVQVLSEITLANRVTPDWQQVHACICRIASEIQKVMLQIETTVSPDEDRTLANASNAPRSPMKNALLSMRANFTFQSVTFRHAVRLGSTLTIATLLYRFSPLPRGYWLPLTALVILRPEFSITFTRGIARVIGTLLGAVVASVILLVPDSLHVLGAILVALLLWGMYTVLNYNLVLFTGILTAEVVVLLSFFENVQASTTIGDRVVYTIIGSALAFGAYLIWPTWLHRSLPNAIADLVHADRDYVHSIFEVPEGMHGLTRDAIRKKARLARTNTINLVNQALKEPARGPLDKEAVKGLLAGLNRFAESLLALESHFPSGENALQENEEVLQFGRYVSRCLTEIEGRLRQQGGIGTGSDTFQEDTGVLDTVSPYTKQELNNMNVPASLKSIFIRIEDHLGTMFRMVST